MKEPKDFKGTLGKWQTFEISNICMGVEATDTEGLFGYGQVLCNPILPDTDGDYELEREEIISNMTLMAHSKELLICLQDAIEVIDMVLMNNTTANKAKELIAKALNK